MEQYGYDGEVVGKYLLTVAGPASTAAMAALTLIFAGVWFVSVPFRGPNTPAGRVATDTVVSQFKASGRTTGWFGSGIRYTITGRFSTLDSGEHLTKREQVAPVLPHLDDMLPVIYSAGDQSRAEPPPGRTERSWLVGVVGLMLTAFVLSWAVGVHRARPAAGGRTPEAPERALEEASVRDT
jgi:hypothetical protein